MNQATIHNLGRGLVRVEPIKGSGFTASGLYVFWEDAEATTMLVRVLEKAADVPGEIVPFAVYLTKPFRFQTILNPDPLAPLDERHWHFMEAQYLEAEIEGYDTPLE